MCTSVSPGCSVGAKAASLVPLGCQRSAGRRARGRLQAVEDEAGEIRGGETDQITTVQQRGLQTFPAALYVRDPCGARRCERGPVF